MTDPKCPTCLGEGRIHGTYRGIAASLECPTCTPDHEPLPPFTEDEMNEWEQALERRNYRETDPDA